MTLRHMKILVAVFQQGSVTKAAQALHLAQPSVSLAIRELEEYYGVALFDRIGRRLTPTAGGNAFYGYAVHIVSLMDELETQMRNWDALGAIRLGATITIGTHLLPELVRQYQEQFPELRVEVKICKASQVEQLLLDNAIDIGLIETQPEHPDLQADAFLEDELCAIVPPGSALAQKASVTLPELAQQPFLMRETGSSGRKILDAAFALHHLSVSPAWESVSTQAIIQAVSEGLGVAVLPKLLVERDVKDGAVIMLPFDVPLRRTLYIVHHRQKLLSSNMQRFMALCRTAKLPNIG